MIIMGTICNNNIANHNNNHIANHNNNVVYDANNYNNIENHNNIANHNNNVLYDNNNNNNAIHNIIIITYITIILDTVIMIMIILQKKT